MRATSNRLNILHVATINKPITSQMGYGPIESVIFNLDKGLHNLGHRSIVACSSDSAVTGEKVETVSESHGDYWHPSDLEGKTRIDFHLTEALRRARMGDIDIVHMHEWFERIVPGNFDPPVPIVMTLHVPCQHSGITRLNGIHPGPDSIPFPNLVAISEYQRRQYAELIPVATTVPHGIDVDQFLLKEESNRDNYLFHIGRITRVKGQDIAIEVAKKSGTRLVLAGCVQNKKEDVAFFARLKKSIDLIVDVGQCPVKGDYYEKVMKPILSSDKKIIYVGELDTAAKKHWFRHAQATLFPIRWGEPFGMVLIESMASGTPILAFGEGAVPEIVKQGETGFIVDSVQSMVRAVPWIEHIARRSCWQHVKTQFSIQRMAEGYIDLYQQLIETSRLRTDSGQPLDNVTTRTVNLTL